VFFSQIYSLLLLYCGQINDDDDDDDDDDDLSLIRLVIIPACHRRTDADRRNYGYRALYYA